MYGNIGRAVEAQARVNLYLWNTIWLMVLIWFLWWSGVFSDGKAGRAGVLDHDESGRLRAFASQLTFLDPEHEDSVFMKGLMVDVGGDEPKKVDACTLWNYFNPERVKKEDYQECNVVDRVMGKGCGVPETNYDKCFKGMQGVVDALKIPEVESKDEAEKRDGKKQT